MNLSVLSDPLLLLIMLMAGFVSMATSLQVATRPAAVRTGLVATALTMGQLVFIVTRFGNMFYLPLLGNYMDQASRSGDTPTLISQMRWVVVGSAAGALLALLLLPTFVELCSRGVRSIKHRGMIRALLNFCCTGKAWKGAFASISRPSFMGTKLFRFKGIPRLFLVANVLASAIWTVGALAAVTVSGLHPEFKQTAILLSGLVNSVAAISFSIWVDPQAALITDQAKDGRRTESQVLVAAVHLILGNFVGCLLGGFLLSPAVSIITRATIWIGHSAAHLDATMVWLIVGNATILVLNGTIYSSRISAVQTAKVATAIAVFNFFSLISRLAGQVYGPFVGAVTDQLTHRSQGEALSEQALHKLEFFNRGLLGGATAGCLLGMLLIPTFVKVYNSIIQGLDDFGSLPKVLLRGLHPKRWAKAVRMLTAPWHQNISREALDRIPKGFLYANVLALTFQSVGQLAAIYAGATFSPEVARTTTLLSPLINGIATITLSILVDPGCATLVDEAIEGKRRIEDIETMTLFLAGGTVVGTLVSQVIFVPAAWFISHGAQLMDSLL